MIGRKDIHIATKCQRPTKIPLLFANCSAMVICSIRVISIYTVTAILSIYRLVLLDRSNSSSVVISSKMQPNIAWSARMCDNMRLLHYIKRICSFILLPETRESQQCDNVPIWSSRWETRIPQSCCQVSVG